MGVRHSVSLHPPIQQTTLSQKTKHQKSPEITRNHQQSPAITMPKGSGLTKPLKLSAELKKLLASEEDEMSRPQVVKALWAHIKANKLQDPDNKQYFTPDKAMEGIFGTEKIRAFGMAKFLKGHLG